MDSRVSIRAILGIFLVVRNCGSSWHRLGGGQEGCSIQRTIWSQMSPVLRGRTLSYIYPWTFQFLEQKIPIRKKKMPVSVSVSVTCNPNILTSLGDETYAGGLAMEAADKQPGWASCPAACTLAGAITRQRRRSQALYFNYFLIDLVSDLYKSCREHGDFTQNWPRLSSF